MSASNNTTSANQPKRNSRKGFNRLMKITRRIHMYLGLLLVPWVVLFGMSGFLFNHNSTFWGGDVQTLATFTGTQISQDEDLQLLNLDTETQRILAAINSTPNSNYTLDGSPWLDGHLTLSASSNKKNLTLKLDPSDGSTTITTNLRKTPKQEKPAFDNQKLDQATFSIEDLSNRFTKLLATEGIPLDGQLEIPARGSNAEIRFLLRDETGKRWRGSYNLATSTLAGVADDAASGNNFATAMTRLHKTHHYPDTFGARWLWSLIGDITALSLVVWGLTGLIMWWQIKPTRVIGAISVFAAAIIAFYIFAGTLDDYTHNPVQIRSR